MVRQGQVAGLPGLDKVAQAVRDKPALRLTVVGTANLEREADAVLRRVGALIDHLVKLQGCPDLSACRQKLADLKGRKVLVLDDILDEGHTLAAIVEHLREEGADAVHTAVLVHKLHDRKASPGMRADVSGLDIEDRYLFGCGIDYKGYWRNAPGIYALKGH